MAGNVPGILPKAALVGSKAVYYPFTIPQRLNDSATLTGSALNGAANGIVNSMGSAYAALEPKGPAKWLLPMFERFAKATVRSQEIADRNKAVFWDPFSQGVEGVGRAIAGPGTYWYLKKSGIDAPTEDMIKGALNTKLFHFPTPDELGGSAPAPAPDPAPSEPAPSEPAPGEPAPGEPAPGGEAPSGEAPSGDPSPAPNGNPGPIPEDGAAGGGSPSGDAAADEAGAA